MSNLDATVFYEKTFPAYLILGLKANIRIGRDCERVCFPEIFSANLPSYSIIATYEEEREFPHAMILIEGPSGDGLSVSEAFDLVHLLQSVLSICYFCITRVQYEYSLLPIADTLLAAPPPWSLELIVSQSRPLIGTFFASTNELEMCFGSYSGETIEVFEKTMPLLGRCISNANLQLATSYLYESMKQLGWDVCDWREEGYDPEATRYVYVGAAESAFQNAYKAIEAVVGDPGKDRSDRKIKTRLQAIGLDPFEPIGYLIKEPWIERFKRYYAMRDSIAAHGSGKHKRPLKMAEIIDLQAMARHILLSYAEI